MKEPAWLIGIFALLSALLAALGLYGVVSHSVSQQRREIGIRMALGARSSEVLSMVIRQRDGADWHWPWLSAWLAAVGLTRVTQSLLFEVSALDPSAFAIAATAMMAIGVVAALVPATSRHPRRSHHGVARGIEFAAQSALR